MRSSALSSMPLLLVALLLPPGRAAADDTADDTVDSARQLLDAALAAHGGEKKLRTVKTIIRKGTLTGVTSELTGRQTTYVVLPDRKRQEDAIFSSIQVLDGDRAWLKIDTDPASETPHLVAALTDAVWRDSAVILLHHLDADTKVTAAGAERIGTKDYDAVIISRGDGTAETKLLLDRKTHRIARIAFHEVFGQEARDQVRELGDYRRVSGVWVPFRVRYIETAGSGDPRIGDLVYSKIQINAAVADALFVMPAD